jgi:tetratricopeptide (TPR) repeat protein
MPRQPAQSQNEAGPMTDTFQGIQSSTADHRRRITEYVLTGTLASVLLVGVLSHPIVASAAPTSQSDPPSQCAKGVELYKDGKVLEASLLLEDGFANRNKGTFSNPEQVGECALYLGFSRLRRNDRSGALSAYQVALQAFESAGSRSKAAVTLYNIGGVLRKQDQYSEALDAYQQALSIYQLESNRFMEAVVLNDEGLVFVDLGNYDKALETYQQALAIHREVGNRGGEGVTLTNLGTVYAETGHNREALECFQEALKIQREQGDLYTEGATLNSIGMLYQNQGSYADALTAYQQSLDIARKTHNQSAEGAILGNMGLLYQAQGSYVEALETHQQALAIIRRMNDRANEAATLNNIGEVLIAQGHYAEALEKYQQALVIHRELGRHRDVAAALGNIGSVYLARGDYIDALQAFQQSVTILQEVGDSAGTAVSLDNIGSTYFKQGRYSEALEMHQKALAIFRQTGNRADEGRTLGKIGDIYHSQDRYTEALKVYEEALAIENAIGDNHGAAPLLNNIGEVYTSQGRYAEALQVLEQALSVHHQSGNRPFEASTLQSISAVYIAQGRYAKAMELLHQALLIKREVGMRASEGSTLNGIGILYGNQGRYGEALDTLLQALAIRREVGDRSGEGVTLTAIGAIYADQGRLPKALETLQLALSIAREVGEQVNTGTALLDIGVTQYRQGNFTDAAKNYEEALTIFRTAGARRQEGTVLDNLGGVYAQQKRSADALRTYEQALKIMREVGDRAGEGVALNNIAQILQEQGHAAEALQNYQQALALVDEIGNQDGKAAILSNIGFIYDKESKFDLALSYYEQSISALETVRAIAGDDIARAAYADQYMRLYVRAASLYYQQNQDQKAFLISEKGRARAFLDSLGTGQIQFSDDAMTDLLTREQEAYAERQSARDALAEYRTSSQSSTDHIADAETRLKIAEQNYAAVLDRIEEHQDQLADLVPGRNALLDVPSVQSLLDEQTTVIDYYLLGSEGALAFIITRNEFYTVMLPEATPDNLYSAVQSLYPPLNKDNPYPLPLRNLHKWLIVPLMNNLHTPRVGIVPHQVLHYVPFAALTDGQTYFGQQHSLFLLPSTSTLPFIRAKAEQVRDSDSHQGLVLGNPVTDDPTLPPLVYAADEAQTVANSLGIPAYIGADASETRLRSSAAETRVLHIAAHGGYNLANPLYSAISLAPHGTEGNTEANDGRLEVHEIFGLDLRSTDLVVLSACETQAGQISDGDELVGMTRAFFSAGAPSVIASLWPVDDAATKDLMVAFYQHWRTGMGKAEALQAAQADVRAKYPGPFYWAAFVLNGDPGDLIGKPFSLENNTSTTSDNYLFLGGMVGFTVLTILSILVVRKRLKRISD